MEEEKDLDHSIKLRMQVVGENINKIKKVVSYVVSEYNLANSYEVRIGERDVLHLILIAYPEDVAKTSLDNGRIVEMAVAQASVMLKMTVQASYHKISPLNDPPF